MAQIFGMQLPYTTLRFISYMDFYYDYNSPQGFVIKMLTLWSVFNTPIDWSVVSRLMYTRRTSTQNARLARK